MVCEFLTKVYTNRNVRGEIGGIKSCKFGGFNKIFKKFGDSIRILMLEIALLQYNDDKTFLPDATRNSGACMSGSFLTDTGWAVAFRDVAESDFQWASSGIAEGDVRYPDIPLYHELLVMAEVAGHVAILDADAATCGAL